jgi:hypothetical protein
MGIAVYTPMNFLPQAVPVASLPAAGLCAGQLYVVNNALLPALGVAVAGGGLVVCAVQSNGVSWLVI